MIPGLDALRAAAVLLVVGFHFLFLPSGSGSLGVMVFFVLSGFLITRLLLAEYQKRGTISLSRFYRRRAFRIFPVFYLCWALETLLIVAHHQQLRWWEPLVSFLYLTNYARAIVGFEAVRHMNIAWSLAIEEQFYFLWPAALLWMLSRRKNAIGAVAILIGAVWIYRAILFLHFHASWSYIYNAFDTRIDALMVGALLALLVSDEIFSKLAERPLASPWLGALTVAVLAADLALERRINEYPWLELLNFSCQPVIIGVLLVQVIHFGASSWRVLGHPILRFLARISYSLYLLHALVLEEGRRLQFPGHTGTVFGFRLLDAQHHPRLMILLIPALILPVISYYFVELPFMRLRDRKPSELHKVREDRAVAQEGWTPAASVAAVNET